MFPYYVFFWKQFEQTCDQQMFFTTAVSTKSYKACIVYIIHYVYNYIKD